MLKSIDSYKEGLSAQFKNKKVCIKYKLGFKHPKTLSAEDMPSDTPLT
jgi:hypothetical protein